MPAQRRGARIVGRTLLLAPLVIPICGSFGVPANAQDIVIPSWDMKAFCTERLSATWRVNNANPNALLRAAALKECRSAQDEAFERVRVNWHRLTADSKKACLEYVLSDPPPSYFRLDACTNSALRQ